MPGQHGDAGEHGELEEAGEEEEDDEDEDEEDAYAEDCDGRASDYAPFAWRPPRAAPSPTGAPGAESPLVCLVRRMTSGLLCAEDEEDEEGDEMERRRLFPETADEPEEGPARAGAPDGGARGPGGAAPRVALGRYEFRPADVIGSGGFGAVRRGVDLATGRPVAIKTYSGMEARGAGAGGPEAAAELRRQFADEVRVLGALHCAQRAAAGRPRPDSASFLLTDGLPERLLDDLPPSRELFVELLDFSRRGDAPCCPAGHARPAARVASRTAEHRPGPALDGQCYLVLELASETLEDYLARAGPLPLPEAERVFGELCEVVAALHGLGFVHLDLKPANLMRFPASGRFKLIDMDGMRACGALVPSSEVISTSKYCAPEVALAALEDEASEDDVSLRVSRLLDVFSLGLIGAELASGAHPLEDRWCRFMEGEEEDEAGFLRELADPRLEVPLPAALREASPELAALLGSMLRARGRASMPEVLASPLLRRARAEVAKTPRTLRSS